MTKYLTTLLASLLALLLLACGGSEAGETNEGRTLPPVTDAPATTEGDRLDGLTVAVHETPG
ncbi:MAG: hypothetical protein HOH95_11000 [Dehalococcoidia bacterium]|jgi:hypothetical protein|nr:hypothetical protein [Dehalococcoidia bacterium]